MSIILPYKNDITLQGKLSGPIKVLEGGIIKFIVKTERFSSVEDAIPVLASTEMLSKLAINMGSLIYVDGEIRTKNYFDEGKRKLDIFVSAKRVEKLNVDKTVTKDSNSCEIIGTLCKKGELRLTPSGKIIQDGMLAVNDLNLRKNYYVPFINWGGSAKFFNEYYQVGDHLQIKGRLQSREYQKVVDGIETIKTAYEVSTCKFDRV